MKKIFTFLCAALMSVGMFAATVVTITDSDFPASESSFTKDGVTVSAYAIDGMQGNISGPGSFSTTLGNFTKIEVSAASISVSGEGWSGDYASKTWTGNASSVSFTGSINGYEEGTTLKFTIEESAPAEVTVVFAANDKTVERTVTLPHTFKCDWNNGMDGPDELDIIIHELYNDYYYCNNNIQASGSDQVEVGTEEAPKNDYITIKGVFEGTATVTGDYFDWITGEEGAHNYSITISIKGDEPEPEDPNREYLSLDPNVWTWGYNSVSGTVAGGLQTTITSDWGALSMGWDPERDLSEWDKIVFEVSHMDGCDGQWFKLKAYLRDASDSEGKQMEGLLGLDAPDNELNYLVIDLHQQVEGFDLTKARVLAVQCEPTGGIFTISSVYLLKESEPSAIDNTVVTEKAQKVVVDGMIYIVRDGKLFNLQGAQVK